MTVQAAHTSEADNRGISATTVQHSPNRSCLYRSVADLTASKKEGVISQVNTSGRRACTTDLLLSAYG